MFRKLMLLVIMAAGATGLAAAQTAYSAGRRIVICKYESVPPGGVVVGQTTEARCARLGGPIDNAWVVLLP
jgi:hypothetical protein